MGINMTNKEYQEHKRHLLRIAEQAEGLPGYGITPNFSSAIDQLVQDARIDERNQAVTRFKEYIKDVDIVSRRFIANEDNMIEAIERAINE